MAWGIEFDPAAKKELDKLGHQNAQRIIKFLFERLAPYSTLETLANL